MTRLLFIARAPSVAACVLGAVAMVAAHGIAYAQSPSTPGLKPRPGVRADVGPVELEGAEISEKLGDKLPLDATFRDQSGKPVTLKSLFDGNRPVLLTFYYSRCPMLCSLQLGDLVDVLNKTPWIVGDKFRVISISMDHRETHREAFATREGYLDRYVAPEVSAEQRFTTIERAADGQLVARWKASEHGKDDEEKGEDVDSRTAIAEGWTFLTGEEEQIRRVADAVGFQFNYVEAKKEFAHPTAVIALSPGGKVVSYLHGLSYKPKDLIARVISAGLAEPTKSTEQFLYSCFHFVKPSGFALVASKAMRWGGFLFLLLIAAVVATMQLRKRRRRRATAPATNRVPRSEVG